MPLEKITCSVCDSSAIEEKTDIEQFTYKDTDFEIVDFTYSVCTECGTEFVNPKQTKRNDQKIRDRHRVIDGLLSGSDIRRIRKKLGLTQHAAAQVFGGGTNAFSKYEKGEVIQSVAMDRLLRVAESVPDVYEALCLISRKSLTSPSIKNEQTVNLCDYGECEVADAKVLPGNVISYGKFRRKKGKQLTNMSKKPDWKRVNNE